MKQWVVDLTIETAEGMLCFCPIEGDINGKHYIITGMNLLTSPDSPPGPVVAVIHEDGQEAVERAMEARRADFDRLRDALRATAQDTDHAD